MLIIDEGYKLTNHDSFSFGFAVMTCNFTFSEVVRQKLPKLSSCIEINLVWKIVLQDFLHDRGQLRFEINACHLRQLLTLRLKSRIKVKNGNIIQSRLKTKILISMKNPLNFKLFQLTQKNVMFQFVSPFYHNT